MHKRGTLEMVKLQYAYDETGNILSETRTDKVRTTTTTKATGYEYDSIGQLTRVDDANENATWTYEYDLGGNIKRKREYAYYTGDLDARTPLSDIEYKYNRLWKDKLDSYNGKWIGYDRIGNPVSYDNWTYEWQAGRQLKKMTKWSAAPDKPAVYGEVSVNSATMVPTHKRGTNDAGHTLSLANMELKVNAAGYKLENGELIVDYEQSGTRQQTIEYIYDPNGLRTQKKVQQLNASGTVTSAVTTDYILHGKLLMELRQGAETLHFYYDAQSRPVMVKHGANYYTYLSNLQGDILALVDTGGNRVVEYKYDAWGRLIAMTGTAPTLGKLNPFRYRGYVYDEETGLYYLRSRYYNPEWGRFINTDSIDATIEHYDTLISGNLFTYCRNNPVVLSDDEGEWGLPNWAKVAIGVVVIAGLAIATVATGGAAAVICGAALTGAISGGASGAVIGAIGGAFDGGVQGAIDGAADGFMKGTLIGGASGAASAVVNVVSGATQVVGNAHGTVLHKLSSNMQAGKMAMSGRYSQIGLNKACKTMGLNGGLNRPDVIGITKNGAGKLVEVVSLYQKEAQVAQKMASMLSQNPNATGKVVYWVRGVGKVIRYGQSLYK